METDFNKRVRKVLINTSLIASVSIITYLLYSTIEKNKMISEKDKRILIDSMTIIAKVKELKVLKTAYEQLEHERDSMGLTNDSLVAVVSTLNEYIAQAEQRDSVNLTKLALFNVAIKQAKEKLSVEKKELKHIEEEFAAQMQADPTATASVAPEKKSYMYLQRHPDESVDIHIDQMELEPISRTGKILEKNQYTVKQIKHVRVKFVIMKSSLTRTVQKIFSVQLIQPNGNAYKFNPDYDYTFVDRNKIHMSNKTKVDVNGNERHVAFLYPKATPFMPGQNIVQLFCDNKFLAEKEIYITK
ncbi:MAG TPA: hypothetical protein VNB90_02195 [Cytophagaceae bacterium]|jgi:hypothetical protein|nr:hypothetical protein [Cytophagaceae bacterium]